MALIENVLRGLSIDPLPDSWTPLEVSCMVKCLGDAGKPEWALRMTHGLNDKELLGALVIQVELLKKDILNDYVEEDD